MTSTVLNWVTDVFARADIIDLYFTITDLFDIPLTEDEETEMAYFDTYTQRVSENYNPADHGGTPLGKLVI